MTFMTEIMINQQQIHSNDLSEPPFNWKAMLSHRHAEEFRRAAEIEYKILKEKGSWVIVDKNEVIQLIFLKWVFTYKYNADGFLIKHKTRLIVRNDMQKMNNQNVYVATLTFKMFRTLIVLMTTFSLKTRQLNAINVFLNAHNNETIYCYMFDEYRQPKNFLKMLKNFYEQRKFSLLWLKTLCIKCMKLNCVNCGN